MRGEGFNTLAVQAHADGNKENRPLSLPIVQSTTFQVSRSADHGAFFKNGTGPFYQRFGHPTISSVAEKLASLEGAEAGLVFGSGMGAITTSLLTVLNPGDHVVAQRSIFAQTYQFLHEKVRSLGIETTFVDPPEPSAVENAIRPNTVLIYIETPSNPLLRIVDIEAVGAIARRRKLLLFVDSTFASPYVQTPLALGASLVLHSGTKFLGGHSDVMSGAALGNTALINRIKKTQILLGSIIDPHAAWLVMRGIKTLGLRVQRQCDNALQIARFLSTQVGIRQVHYPWLEHLPDYNVAKKQMRGGGGVVSFEVHGGLEEARSFVDSLEHIPIATSLGGVETIIEIPYELDFSDEELGATPGENAVSPALIRLAVGIEDLDDLLIDLRRGLKGLQQKKPQVLFTQTA